jgi:hypothetical protein
MEVTINPNTEAAPLQDTKPVLVNGVLTITLKDGRSVGIRKMGPMHQMRMCSIIGAENSKNELYRSVAVPAYCVVSINGKAEPTPQTVLALEALADRLGDVALLEITLAITENFPDEDVSQIVDEFKKRQEIKNS